MCENRKKKKNKKKTNKIKPGGKSKSQRSPEQHLRKKKTSKQIRRGNKQNIHERENQQKKKTQIISIIPTKRKSRGPKGQKTVQS